MAAKMKTEKSKSNSLSSKAIEFLRSVDAGKVNKNPIKAKNDIIDEIKDEAKGNTYADYKSDFAAIEAYSSDGMAQVFYDELKKVFKSKLDGCRISAIINDGYKNIGKVAVNNYAYKQKGKEKASTITKVENHLAKALSEAEAFFDSINKDD